MEFAEIIDKSANIRRMWYATLAVISPFGAAALIRAIVALIQASS